MAGVGLPSRNPLPTRDGGRAAPPRPQSICGGFRSPRFLPARGGPRMGEAAARPPWGGGGQGGRRAWPPVPWAARSPLGP
jgi:hypothetical protein